MTPRFPVSCSYDLLKQLGELAREYDLPIQSHLCEQKDEIKFTLELFPNHCSVTQIFDDTGLLTDKVKSGCVWWLPFAKCVCFSKYIQHNKVSQALCVVVVVVIVVVM